MWSRGSSSQALALHTAGGVQAVTRVMVTWLASIFPGSLPPSDSILQGKVWVGLATELLTL